MLELSLLRTFVSAVTLQGFAKAAEKLKKSPSAVTMQIQLLEQRVGTPLFRPLGRSKTLTRTGIAVFEHAQRLLALDDEFWAGLHARESREPVVFGVAEDFAGPWLAGLLSGILATQPQLRVDIKLGSSHRLAELYQQGRLDLLLSFGAGPPLPTPPIGELPLHWYARSGFRPSATDAWPLLMMEPPCPFHAAVTQAAHEARFSWRLALMADRLPALWAAASAGLGIVARTPIGLPAGLVDVGTACGLPPLPTLPLSLCTGPDAAHPAVGLLHSKVEQALRDDIGLRLAPEPAEDLCDAEPCHGMAAC